MSNNSDPKPEEKSLNIVQKIISACEEAKGHNIAVLDVSEVFNLSDYFVIVSGRSDRQVQGICNRITFNLAKHDIKPLAVEGFDDGHWILIDCGEILVHIFYEPLREHYDIEGLWLRARRLELEKRRGPNGDELRAA